MWKRIGLVVVFLAVFCVLAEANYFKDGPLEKARRICSMKNCKSYRTTNSTYDNFFDVKIFSWPSQYNYLVKMHFYVWATRDFRLLLSDSKDEHIGFLYEFVIGDRQNTHTSLRRIPSDLKMTENITPNILDSSVPLRIDLQITDGGLIELKVEDKAVVQTKDSSPVLVKYVSFATYNESIIDVFYSCQPSHTLVSSADRAGIGTAAFASALLILALLLKSY